MASSESGTELPQASSSQVFEALLIGLVGLVVLGGLFWWMTREPGADDSELRGATDARPVAFTRDDFVGDDTCAECHPSIAVYHERNGHSRTFRPAADRALADRLDGRVVEDPERPGVTWTFLLEHDAFAVERRLGDRVDRLPIDFALGSGYHATTFLGVLDDDPDNFTVREHRLTYFADDSIRMTPGQKMPDPDPGTDALGRVLTGEDSFNCVKCHVTLTSETNPGTIDVHSMIPTVSCERCHGPGRSHVEAALRIDAEPDSDTDPSALAMPFGPNRYSASAQMLLCGSCHRHPSMAPSAAIRPENQELARFQPVGLMQSECYTQSNGALSCTTCHDPHDRPSRDVASYNATCLSCHTPSHADQVPCPVSPSQDCTSCHMPRVNAGQGIGFADHWIRVRDDLEVQEATGTDAAH